MVAIDATPPEPVRLGPDESVKSRPFTSVAETQRDRTMLDDLLADMRRLLRDAAAGETQITPYETVQWRAEGRVRRHVVCNEARLRSHPGLCVVGFFGERRTGMDTEPLEEANAALVASFAEYPGITSYSSAERHDGNWGNLVLHDDPVDTDYWRQSALHAEAVRMLSPLHYRTVRIHNAVLTAPVPHAPAIVLSSTKYFDFSVDPEWRGLRAHRR